MATQADTLTRTNERPGTRAHLRNLRTSPYKVREVLDLVRGQNVRRAQEILRFCERGPAVPVAKLLKSAMANAVENDGMDADELFISACFADEGATMKRFRPRAKGRASRIRKRTCHVTIVVDRLPEERLTRLREEQAKSEASRGRRVAGSRSNSGSRAARVAGARKAKTEAAAEENPEATAPVSEAPEQEAPETSTAVATEDTATKNDEGTEKKSASTNEEEGK